MVNLKNKYYRSKDYDWKSNLEKRGWPYRQDAPNDPEYIKDRSKLFKEAGNGWWWYQGTTMWKNSYNTGKIKKLADK